MAERDKVTHQLHANQEMILFVDQELEHLLAQRVLGGQHLVIGMRDNPRLENRGEIYASRPTQVGLATCPQLHPRVNADSLPAVIRFTSARLANTLNMSSTYNNRY